MTDEKLLEEANKARAVAMILAESIYRYLGNEIDKDQLKAITNTLLSEARVKFLEHRYIYKDLTDIGAFDTSSNRDDLNDVEELNITD